jgi:hypothetical protein
MKMKINRSPDQLSLNTSTTDDLSGLIDRVRLAFALASGRERRPVLIPTWQKVITPLMGSLPSHRDPQLMAARVPTLLSLSEVESWRSWLGIVMAADLSQLNLAITRILRAQTERRDDSDALIDAVIAWESLFGAVTESTLRVSASLARLLHESGTNREDAQSRYSKIYSRRSNIVHGAQPKYTPEQINKDSRDAITAALEAIRMLLVKRSDLLLLDSTTRSVRMLLEDYRFDAAEDSPPSETGS